ncbi:MAG: class I SAM-dependent methyltransferase [Myxococcales bacterium]|nr:class I SAM-dependent methyltransferase [Myxococcales bacterium]
MASPTGAGAGDDPLLAALPTRREAAGDFTPRSTLPYDAQAEQLLRCRVGGSFMGLRPIERVEREVAGLWSCLGLRAGHAVLDLGCGPGLYGSRLGARGARVTGIDLAAAAVEHARAEAEAHGWPCRYLRGSYLELDAVERFDAAFLNHGMLGHLEPAEQDVLLRGLRRALRPNGRLALEVDVAPPGLAAKPPSETRQRRALAASPWSDRPHRWLERKLLFPAERQRVVHHVIAHHDGSIREHWVRLELLVPAELEQRLREHGLQPVQWLDPSLTAPPSADAPTRWVVARAQG